ncbi:MAG: hypothetical protein AB7N24_21925 [Dehalococcoidia bacterium]
MSTPERPRAVPRSSPNPLDTLTTSADRARRLEDASRGIEDLAAPLAALRDAKRETSDELTPDPQRLTAFQAGADRFTEKFRLQPVDVCALGAERISAGNARLGQVGPAQNVDPLSMERTHAVENRPHLQRNLFTEPNTVDAVHQFAWQMRSHLQEAMVAEQRAAQAERREPDLRGISAATVAEWAFAEPPPGAGVDYHAALGNHRVKDLAVFSLSVVEEYRHGGRAPRSEDPFSIGQSEAKRGAREREH